MNVEGTETAMKTLHWGTHNLGTPLPNDVVDRFKAFLKKIPWDTLHPDWRAIPHESIAIDAASTSDVQDWLRAVALGRHNTIGLVRDTGEAIALTREDFVVSLSEVLALCPNPVFLFGLNKRADGWEVQPAAMGEYDGVQFLRASKTSAPSRNGSSSG